MSRRQVRVAGTVQGVGFRPHVYRLAHELDLGGFVLNDAQGVLVEVEGPPAALDRFLERLRAEAPPLARIEHVDAAEVPPTGERGFQIVGSRGGGEQDAPVSPDTATCADCLAELDSPADRRYRYPFINCTNCGPRFTIVRGVPYDRPQTTMAGFRMCALCQAEYEDPLDRRFHAQPNACPDCGPTLRFGAERGEAALAGALAALEAGRIVAVKGIGGFHLACRADDAGAVDRAPGAQAPRGQAVRDHGLRRAAARRLVELDPAEEALLVSRARPIVIARRRRHAPRSPPAVAPRSAELGVMVAYSPLHHLLVADRPLVMTSGNVSDEPIAYADEDAAGRLTSIADAFLLHDRPIHTRTDDSVVRAGVMLRRSRGYVPDALELPVAAERPLLACGAELKSTFCLAKGRRAWVSHHIGDLKNYETLLSFREGVRHFERLFAVTPELVVHDMHPDYLSTREAQRDEDAPTLAVQHHHAHLAACLAEYGETGPAVGAIYDGAGYGTDGTVWGGEILVGDLTGFSARATCGRWPCRGATARSPSPGAWPAPGWPRRPATRIRRCRRPCATPSTRKRWRAVARLARTAPRTSSVGRLFDAVAALCGVRAVVNFEGQAAIELESLADPTERAAYPLDAALDPRDLIVAVARDVRAGVPVGLVSARFHNARRARHGGGGQVDGAGHGRPLGRRLPESPPRRADRRGPGRPALLVPRLLPAGDGGISFGQAAIAAASGA